MLFRITSIMMVVPVYGYTAIPVTIRMALSFLVTCFIFPLHPEIAVTFGSGIIEFFGAVVKEVVIGVSVGLVTTFIFHGIMFAGHVIGHSMGFTMINVLDPQTQANVPIISQILNLFVIILFLLVGGHHFLIMAIDEMFVRIPIGAGVLTSELVEGFTRLSADIFVIGVKLGAPVLVAILVTEFVLGFLARTVPQMNVWILGFPLKIGVGLFTMALSLPMMVYLFTKMYGKWQGNVVDFILAMVSG